MKVVRLAAVVVLVAVVAPAAAATVTGSRPSATDWAARAADLPAPYDGWDVAVEQDPDDRNLVTLRFDSEAVGQRATSLVWLPDRYHATTDPLPVAYYLHGQVDTATMGAGPALHDAGVPLPFPFAPGSSRTFGGIDPAATAADRSFLLVGIDNGPRAWCGHCWYTDGVGDAGVDAERHLLDELVPLVEHVFRTRTDRGGRAVVGNSMGANGALLVGFRHPDRFAFVGGLSPTYAGFQEKAVWELWAHVIWSQYTIDQGWGPPTTEEVRYHAFDPLSLAAHVAGADVEVMTVIGDGCVPNDGRGVCSEEPPTGDPDQELGFRRAMDIWTSQLTERGVRYTSIKREGAHSANLNRDSFRRWFLPRMNEVFEREVRDPHTFSYRSIDPAFDIWGWSFAVERPNLEFLHVLGAATDGSDAVLAGTGTVTVTTPPRADRPPARRVRVLVTPDGGETSELVIVPDAAGRVRFTVDLGPLRHVNETRELVETGQHPLPHTHVAVVPMTSASR